MPTLYSYCVKTRNDTPLNTYQRQALQACFQRAAEPNFPKDIKIIPLHQSRDGVYDMTKMVGLRIASLRAIEADGIVTQLQKHLFGEQPVVFDAFETDLTEDGAAHFLCPVVTLE